MIIKFFLSDSCERIGENCIGKNPNIGLFVQRISHIKDWIDRSTFSTFCLPQQYYPKDEYALCECIYLEREIHIEKYVISMINLWCDGK